MTRKQKEKQDEKALKKYAESLKNRRKAYNQTFSAFAINQRRSRAACVGELCLQAIDAVRGLNKIKPLMDGTLYYSVIEHRVVDPDGKKGFQYEVTYHVVSHENAFTEEQIEKEISETREKMRAETEEMFPEEKHEEETGTEDGGKKESGAEDNGTGNESAEEKSAEE